MYSHNRDVLCTQKYILCGENSYKSQNTQFQFAAESEETQLWIFFFKQVSFLVAGNRKLLDEIKDSKML